VGQENGQVFQKNKLLVIRLYPFCPESSILPSEIQIQFHPFSSGDKPNSLFQGGGPIDPELSRPSSIPERYDLFLDPFVLK
jgi:hypothetical protein